MLATVVCTKCGSVKEITSRSVVFPFVCESCEQFGTEERGENNEQNQ